MDAVLLSPLLLGAALSASSLYVEAAELASIAPSLAVTSQAGGTVSVFSLPGGQLLERELAKGKVSAVAAGQPGAAWIDQQAASARLQVRLNSGIKVEAVMPPDLRQARLAWLGERVALLGDQGGELYDPRSRQFVDHRLAMPPEAAGLFEQSYVQSSSGGLVAFIRPYSLFEVQGGKRTLSAVTMFAVGGGVWRELGSAATTAPRYSAITGVQLDGQGRYTRAQFKISAPRIALDEVGFMALEDEKVLRVPFARGAWMPERKPLAGPAPSWSEQIAAHGSRLWRLSQGRLISQSLDDGGLYAYLPLSGAGAPQRLLSDGVSLWVMTDSGTVRASSPPWMAPEDAAFIKVSLQEEPLSKSQQQLLAELETWMGSKYVFGGNTRAGVDCSGLVAQSFMALGYNLPRQSALLRDSKLGLLVTDRLEAGDVIWTPGHVAIYAGRGEVIEAVKRGVRRNPVWRFKPPIVVRRFLKD